MNLVAMGGALSICKEKGITVSSEGLRFAGKSNNFAHILENKRYLFDRDGLMTWINKKLNKCPEDYISVRDCSILFGLTKSILYKMIKEGKLKKYDFQVTNTSYFLKLKEVEELLPLLKTKTRI